MCGLFVPPRRFPPSSPCSPSSPSSPTFFSIRYVNICKGLNEVGARVIVRTTPNAQNVCFAPDDTFAVVTCLGTDEVLRIDTTGLYSSPPAKRAPLATRWMRADKPIHAFFSLNGTSLYISAQSAGQDRQVECVTFDDRRQLEQVRLSVVTLTV